MYRAIRTATCNHSSRLMRLHTFYRMIWNLQAKKREKEKWWGNFFQFPPTSTTAVARNERWYLMFHCALENDAERCRKWREIAIHTEREHKPAAVNGFSAHIYIHDNTPTNLHRQNRFALLLKKIPRLKIAIHPAKVEEWALCRRPTAIGEIDRAIFRPNNGTFLAVFRPDASIPISNCDKVLAKGWITFQCRNGRGMTLHLKEAEKRKEKLRTDPARTTMLINDTME